MINACIYNHDGIPCGCVTDSCLYRFRDEYEALKSCFGEMPEWSHEMDELGHSLEMSFTDKGADFLNCLRVYAREYRDIIEETYHDGMCYDPVHYLEFVQMASRSYHDLVRYCCSDEVKSEATQEMQELFEEYGVMYRGVGAHGVFNDECAFEYDGMIIGVDMSNDIWAFWNRNYAKRAIIRAGIDQYWLEEYDPEKLVEAIVACIDDYHNDDEIFGLGF